MNDVPPPAAPARTARTLGVITIGQTPRTDLTPELADLLPGVCIAERGALDGLSASEIAELAPVSGDHVMTTRLRDGTAAVVGQEALVRRVQVAILDLQGEVDVLLLACTGTFPEFIHHKPLIEPDHVLAHVLAAVASPTRCVGIICPLAEQEEDAKAKYRALLPGTVALSTAAATPYSTDVASLGVAAKQLRADGAEIIVLDCIGYTARMRSLVVEASGLPVLLARSVAARIAAELLG
ncbi:AroM family protein [Arthrobacter sp. MMS18-M83]|uniref:AroM family protein n=1 Tax=Arthrobacter sp. MMS18-M83 TaxID=2996261 RepID=UPI00227A0649|nr:AroM family protein [Arthrobacter sp. MMS18-M83]WAH95724.1 AroM family protein [Arthrobacter sp. MMS18-M83]